MVRRTGSIAGQRLSCDSGGDSELMEHPRRSHDGQRGAASPQKAGQDAQPSAKKPNMGGVLGPGRLSMIVVPAVSGEVQVSRHRRGRLMTQDVPNSQMPSGEVPQVLKAQAPGQASRIAEPAENRQEGLRLISTSRIIGNDVLRRSWHLAQDLAKLQPNRERTQGSLKAGDFVLADLRPPLFQNRVQTAPRKHGETGGDCHGGPAPLACRLE